MTARDACDVVVVGAGPAGATLAALLASRGRDVVLVERQRFPHDKLCGEFLSPEALATLASVGVIPAVEAAGPARIRSLRLTAPATPPLDRFLAREALGLSRLKLDAALAAAAKGRGAVLRAGFRALEVRPADRSGMLEVVVRPTGATDGDELVRTRAVVDATGRHGGLLNADDPRRNIGARPTRVAFKRHFRARPGETRLEAVEVHAFAGGYCGVSPIEDGLVNACVLASARLLHRVGGKPDDLLRHAGRENRALGARLEGLEPQGARYLGVAVTPAHARPRSSALLRVGDAAAMIAPVCGNGMAMAMRSAELAGDCVDAFLSGTVSWRQALAAYEASWRREFVARLRVGGALQAALVRPVLASTLVRAGRLLPSLVDWTVRVTRDWERAALTPAS